MSDELDFLDDVSQVEPSGDLMAKLSEYVEFHTKYSKAIKILETRLKNGKKFIAEIEDDFIPALMQEASMKEFKTTSFTIKIKSFIRGTIPSQTAIDKAEGEKSEELIERRDLAFSWLMDNGGDSIIKREFSVDLGKGADESIKESLVQTALDLGLPYDDAEKVHAGTLNAFLKEKTEDGVDVPTDTFNLFVGDKAKIVKRK